MEYFLNGDNFLDYNFLNKSMTTTSPPPPIPSFSFISEMMFSLFGNTFSSFAVSLSLILGFMGIFWIPKYIVNKFDDYKIVREAKPYTFMTSVVAGLSLFLLSFAKYLGNNTTFIVDSVKNLYNASYKVEDLTNLFTSVLTTLKVPENSISGLAELLKTSVENLFSNPEITGALKTAAEAAGNAAKGVANAPKDAYDVAYNTVILNNKYANSTTLTFFSTMYNYAKDFATTISDKIFASVQAIVPDPTLSGIVVRLFGFIVLAVAIYYISHYFYNRFFKTKEVVPVKTVESVKVESEFLNKFPNELKKPTLQQKIEGTKTKLKANKYLRPKSPSYSGKATKTKSYSVNRKSPLRSSKRKY